LLELSLTRILSVALWYHFGFLVISTALLGFGVAGTTLSIWPWLRDRAPLGRALSTLAALFAASAVASFWLMQRIPFDPFRVLDDPRQILLGPLYYLVLALPFAAAGLGLALLFSRLSGQATRLYAFDLTGAGTGCLLLLVVLPGVGGSGAIAAVSALGFAAATIFAARGRARFVMAVLAVAAVLVAPFAERLVPIRITALKRRPAVRPLETHWNTASRVEIFELRPPGSDRSVRRFVIDGGTAGTGIQDLRTGVRQYLRAHTDDGDYLSGVAYAGKAAPRLLIIGSGGGSEVLDGLHFGAREIVAVEVNPTIVDAVSRRMRDYWGGLFEQPEVRLVEDEGRSFLRRSHDVFDAIISIHTISNAAVASGAMSLTENFVLTREAFEDYLDRLGPDGMILFSRPEPHMPRLVATAREALRARGVDDATRHLYLFRSVPDAGEKEWLGAERKAFEAELIVKKSPLTDQEIAAIEGIARIGLPPRTEFESARETLYSPRAPERFPTYHRIASTPDLGALYRSGRRQLAPATDDRPFFNHLSRWSSLDFATLRGMTSPRRVGDFMLGDRPVAEASLTLLLVQVTVVAGIFILAPLLRRGGVRAVSREWRPLLFFSALGFGFITIEMALISRITLFLGQPAYTIVVVLGCLLVSSGIGSALAGRLRSPSALRWLLVVLLAAALAASFAMPHVLQRALGLPFVSRLAVVLAMLVPLGALMGMPFPLGIRALGLRAPALVPWAWGVNGFFTVIGTVTSLMIAMTFGFTLTLAVGTACYALAWLAAASRSPAPA